MQVIEAYDYLFCGRKRAHFIIAEIQRDLKIRIVDESAPPVVNLVPSKFLPKFDSLEKARRELEQLVNANGMDIALVRV